MRIRHIPCTVISSFLLFLGASASAQPKPKQLSQLPTEAQPTVWKQLAELTASDAAGNDELGYSVAISGNTVAVGAPYETIGTNEHQGAVYVFTRPASGWSNMTQTAKLTVSDGTLSAYLGYSVAFSGNTIVAGAPGANAAYVFVEPAGGWADTTPIAKFTDPGEEAEFGVSVAISGNTIAVGVPSSDSLGIGQGVVCVYVKPASGWATTTLYNALLTASDGADSNLGYSVSISGNTIVAGDPASNTGQGASYVFVKPATGWTSMTQTATLTASDGMPYDDFGDAVAVGGTIIVVGAPNAVTGTEFGKAYLFVEPSGGWANATQTAALLASDAHSGAQFGWSAAVWGNMVAVGAFAGSTYGYRMPATGWANMPESIELTGTQAAGQGHSTAIGASMIVAGAFDTDNGIGAAYVFGPQ
jgi:hypothetical protein